MGSNDGPGTRSNNDSQSSMMICRQARSPGFFSEKRRRDKAGNGDGKRCLRAVLPICLLSARAGIVPTSEVESALIHLNNSYSI